MAHDPLAQTCQPLKVRFAGLLESTLTVGIQASLHAAPPGPLLQTVKLDLMPDFEIGQGRERDLQLRQEVIRIGGNWSRVDEGCWGAPFRGRKGGGHVRLQDHVRGVRRGSRARGQKGCPICGSVAAATHEFPHGSE